MLSLTSTTVTDNQNPSVPAVSLGEGAFILLSTTVEGEIELSDPFATTTIACSIVRTCSGVGSTVSQGFNLFGFFHGCSTTPLDLQGPLDLLPLDGGPGLPPVRMPSLNSLVIDAGFPALCASVDQWQSNPRAVDGDEDGQAVVDIGAIETPLLIFADGFESGNVSAWSSAAP